MQRVDTDDLCRVLISGTARRTGDQTSRIGEKLVPRAEGLKARTNTMTSAASCRQKRGDYFAMGKTESFVSFYEEGHVILVYSSTPGHMLLFSVTSASDHSSLHFFLLARKVINLAFIIFLIYSKVRATSRLAKIV